MVRHVVMWKFKPGTEAEMHEFLDGLKALKGVVPQIVDQEVGVDWGADGNYDAVLISTFKTREDLASYKVDPRHVEVSKLCKAIRETRVAVDFEY